MYKHSYRFNAPYIYIYIYIYIVKVVYIHHRYAVGGGKQRADALKGIRTRGLWWRETLCVYKEYKVIYLEGKKKGYHQRKREEERLCII